MSETLTKTTVKKSIVPKPQKPRQKKSDVDQFKAWLAGLGLGVPPALHVNGRDFATAVVTVDLGQPLDDEQNRLTSEQTAELVGKLKLATRSLYKEDVNVRVQNDSNYGIWWSSVG